jgi:hypothetical protein
MNIAIKCLIPLTLFVGIIAKPTFAFDSVPLSDRDLLDLAHGRSALHAPSELQKIAAEVRRWSNQNKRVARRNDLTDQTSNYEQVEDDDPVKEVQEIKKLDKIFFDYVMAKFIQRIRRS